MKENAKLKNMYNQLKGKVDTHMAATPGVRGQQFKQPYGGAMRKQYRGGGGPRGAHRGGYNRDPRRSNYQGDSERVKTDKDDSTATTGKKGYFVCAGTEERVAVCTPRTGSGYPGGGARTSGAGHGYGREDAPA